MLQLNIWLRIYGKKRQDQLFNIPKYARVRELLKIWDGAYIEEEKRFVITKDFDGDLIIDSEILAEMVKDELRYTPNGIKGSLSKWMHKMSGVEIENYSVWM